MSPLRLHLCFVLAATFFLANASTQVNASVLNSGDIIQLRRNTSGALETFGAANGGGEFALYKKQTDGTYEFLAKTFCIEYDENVTVNTDFLLGAVSDRAVLGGANTNTGDPVGLATRFLYEAFSKGTLSTFDLDSGIMYDPTSDSWANALQRAFWVLEGERSGFGSSSFSNRARLLHDYAVAQVATADPGDFSGVKALNLFAVGTDLTNFDPLDPNTYNSDGRVGRHRQDQLFFIPEVVGSPNPVPEPGTLIMWSAFALVGARCRRRKSSS